MPQPMRSRSLLLALALLLPLAPLVAPSPDAQGQDVVVRGAGAERAIDLAGGHLLDAYGSFATARLGGAGQELLRGQGFVVEPLLASTGRGAFRFDPAQGDATVPAALRTDLATHQLVAFRGPVKQEWREALDHAATVYDYLPRDSFVIRARESMANVPGVAFLGPYHAGYKLAPGLLGSIGALHLTVLVFPDEDLGRAANDIAATGAEPLAVGFVPGLEGIVKVSADAGQAARIAQLDSVAWLERSAEDASTDNEHATGIVQGGDPAVRAFNDRHIDGSSQVVSICDTGVETTGTAGTARMVHQMFDDPEHPTVTFQQPNPEHRKVLLYYAPVEGGVTMGDFNDANSHGTHTAGTLAGDIAPFGRPDLHDSGAYAAKLAICDIVVLGTFQIPVDYSLMWAPAYGAGARINSNSWGSATGFDYTDVSRQHDAYVSAHRDFVITRSAGNTDTRGMRPESLAKDVISVGNGMNTGSGDIEDMSASSSRGPAADGRLKPDVAAPGDCLMSAKRGTSDGYTCLSGTSMATPTVAAAVALLRDAFAKGYWDGGSAGSGPASQPSAALVRALLFASGHEMTGVGSHPGVYLPQTAGVPWLGPLMANGMGRLPTFLPLPGTFPNPAQGWGRVNLSAVLPPGRGGAWFVDEGAGLATGEQRTFTLHVPGDAPLRVVAAWTDVAAAAGADPALVNDLDLTVTSPEGVAYPGNLWLNSESVALPLPDHINNAEGVSIGEPVAGDWTVTVTGASVPDGPQSFALVAVGAVR